MEFEMYKMFIDDERYPITPDWFIARNSYDAIYAVKNYGFPNEIAFDHDLGGQDTSMVFVKWLTDYMLDNDIKFPKGFIFSVHSMNPIGAEKIKNYMNNFIDEIGYNNEYV